MNKDFWGEGPEADEMRQRYGSIWDNLSLPLRIILVAFIVIYFGSGLVVPFYWNL